MATTTIATVICMIVAAVLWWLLFWVRDDLATSKFRYELWRQRDKFVDDLRAGKMPKDNAAVEMMSYRTIALITDAPNVTLANVVAVGLPLPEKVTASLREEFEEGLKRLSDDERGLLFSHVEAVNVIYSYHLLYRTIHGSFARLVFAALMMKAKVQKRMEDAYLWIPTKNHDHGPLASYNM